jgi:hypothetical protein
MAKILDLFIGRAGLLAVLLGLGAAGSILTQPAMAGQPLLAASQPGQFAQLPSARISTAGLDATYRSCRRQVRRAAGILPGKRMRLPRAYTHFVDRCVANGGVYS